MSLYNDLTTVLTPYANKIKQNESDIGDIQDALEHLDVETDKTLSVDGKPADAKATGDAINEIKADLADKADTIDMLKAFPTDTASGVVASFSDGADGIPLQSLVIDINPVQGGSGDPSLENVRPIAGLTGMQLSISGEDTSNPTVKAISWETEAGTVYGGKLDVLTGELTVDMKYMKFDGSEDEIWYTYSSTGFRIPKVDIGLSKKGICNLAPTVSSSLSYGVMFSASANYIYFFQTVSEWGVSTVADLRTWLATNNVEICYSLATPITYHLTPQEVNSLLGKNNIWADTGDSTVEYRADPTLYANKLTREHMSAIAPVETAYTATRNYTTGELLIVDNTLCKVIANIANGETITPNSNVVATTLSEIISALA